MHNFLVAVEGEVVTQHGDVRFGHAEALRGARALARHEAFKAMRRRQGAGLGNSNLSPLAGGENNIISLVQNDSLEKIAIDFAGT